MATARKAARKSLPASASSIATTSTLPRSRTSIDLTASASAPELRAARSRAGESSDQPLLLSRSSSPIALSSQFKNTYANAIVVTDSDDAIEIIDSSDDDESSNLNSSSMSETDTDQSDSMRSDSPQFPVDDSPSTTTQDHSYATSLTSDIHYISDGTLSSVSSVDSDSDAPNAIMSHANATNKTPQRVFPPLRNSQPESSPTRASEEAQQQSSQSSSRTATPSRRSARIVSSGSSVQKALQRRDELDAKLLAGPVRRKQDSPSAQQPPQPKRPRGRPRKSLPEGVIDQVPAASLALEQTTLSSSAIPSLPSSPAAHSARRSSRLSMPSTLTRAVTSPLHQESAAPAIVEAEKASTPASPDEPKRSSRSLGRLLSPVMQHASASSNITAALISPPSADVAGDPVSQPKRRPGRPRRSQASVLSAETQADSTPSQVPIPPSVVAPTPAVISSAPETLPNKRNAVSDVRAALAGGQEVQTPPVKRRPGRPRKSQNVVSSLPLASSGTNSSKHAGPSNDAGAADVDVVASQPLKRSPGRPRKSQNVVSPSPLASLGMVSSEQAGMSNDANVADTEIVPDPPVKRGPGRPRKSEAVVLSSPLASTGLSIGHSGDLVSTRLRKRGLLSPAASADASSRPVYREDEVETPRLRRGRARQSINTTAESALSGISAVQVHPPQADAVFQQNSIDLLDDNVSELSDASDQWMDSPAPSQSLLTPTSTGAARKRRSLVAGNSEGRKLKRASRQNKDGKNYHVAGLYAGEADAVVSTSSIKQGEEANAVFPAPIHFGAKLLTEERDFCLPFPIHQSMEELRARVNAKRKPPRYQQISKNKYYSRPKLQGEVPLCNCKPGSGCWNDCINRMLMFICDPKTCPNGSSCTNISLGKRPSVKTTVAYYGRRGFGLQTLEAVKSGDFIDEYRGEVIDLVEAAKRVNSEYKATGNFYLLDYDAAAGELLDGGRKGNITRFANHSCEPNCRIEKFIICGTDEALSAEFQIGIFANRDIEAGEELTYNYGWSAFQPRDITGAPTAQVPPEQCLCGAANCAGVLGGKKAPAAKPAATSTASGPGKKAARGKGKGKGKGQRKRTGPKSLLRAMTPMTSSSRLSSAAAMAASTLGTMEGASIARKRAEAQTRLFNKIILKRQQRAARMASEAPSTSRSSAAVGTSQEGPRIAPATKRAAGRNIAVPHYTVSSSDEDEIMPDFEVEETSHTLLDEAVPMPAKASQHTQNSSSAGASEQALEAASAPSKTPVAASSSGVARLPLLKRLGASLLANVSMVPGKKSRGKKDRRSDSAAGANEVEPSAPPAKKARVQKDQQEGSALPGANGDGENQNREDQSVSDTDELASNLERQDDGTQQPSAPKKVGGKTGRRGRHKLQLSGEEAARRAIERRARNAFLARVRRASKRGITIEDPTQHPLKKISIQCTAAPDNTYIPDLPSSLVTLGMSTADARRARNAFLARVRRAMKRGHPKEVAIKMAAKPLPGDPARDTPVMKAQRAYLEQLEREANDELSGMMRNQDHASSQGSQATVSSQPAGASASESSPSSSSLSSSAYALASSSSSSPSPSPSSSSANASAAASASASEAKKPTATKAASSTRVTTSSATVTTSEVATQSAADDSWVDESSWAAPQRYLLQSIVGR